MVKDTKPELLGKSNKLKKSHQVKSPYVKQLTKKSTGIISGMTKIQSQPTFPDVNEYPRVGK